MSSPLFDPVFGSTAASAALTDTAWIRAILDVEVALAYACAAAGLIPAGDAAEIERAATDLNVDATALGRGAKAGGNPVIPLVDLLRREAAAPARSVHHGATSQDIMDTALMLLIRRAGRVVLADARRCVDAAADLARRHRGTLMVARTLGQQAVPTTFGAVAAGWAVSVHDAATALSDALGAAPVQMGGAAGTLAPLHPHGRAVAALLAERLELREPPMPWHTDRVPLARIATAFGILAGACSGPALTVTLLSATEVGEVTEDAPGGSSAMPHKRNPVAAITARAAASRVAGPVSTILSTMSHDHQRASGTWHAEWQTIAEIVRGTGGATARLAECLSGLQVHADVMRRNLDITGGAILAERVTAALADHTDDARAIVTAACASGRRLDEEPRILDHLSSDTVRTLTDPARYIGHASDHVDAALAHIAGATDANSTERNS
ncbi:3-carboxy-cis,cis-muconate cycloisomerase [Tsukamurella tyrosinosolvens]|uniref:3-carboxy-cis,cis-muconate cycloisomerase n=1 Tax=Tsukamurella tyrosinosolvens TaxID=57704 RepID=UPI001CE20A6D|nr:3-carboxy-cis,cis-muconate cycloisomerase [Tsukamurella tyrosinosolvens]MCA4997878.1 3-carboxy-cis,cis-muconate cycloisomerase [Tsukamurella tyrosinosolvens]